MKQVFGNLNAGILAVAALLAAAPAAALEISGYARETLPGAGMSAAYLTLDNDAGRPRTLERVLLVQPAGGAAARVQLHNTVTVDGVSRMRPLAVLSVPAAGRVAMAPGGIHLMLSGAELSAGEQVQLRLHFADGEQRLVQLPVRKVGAPGHRHHH